MNFIVAIIPAPQPARVRAAAQRERELGLPVPNVGTPFPAKDIPKTYFTNEDEALAVAKDLATRNPTVQYGVFSATRVFETTKPQVLEKTYNQEGELVVNKEKA